MKIAQFYYSRSNVKELVVGIRDILPVQVLLSTRNSILTGILYQLSCQSRSFGIAFWCSREIVNVEDGVLL